MVTPNPIKAGFTCPISLRYFSFLIPTDAYSISSMADVAIAAGELVHNQEAHLYRPGTGQRLVLIYNGTLIRDTDGKVRFAFLTLHNNTGSSRARRFQVAPTATSAPKIKSAVALAKHTAAEAAETLLHDMNLTCGEREFCKSLGQNLVKQAIDAYLKRHNKAKVTKAPVLPHRWQLLN